MGLALGLGLGLGWGLGLGLGLGLGVGVGVGVGVRVVTGSRPPSRTRRRAQTVPRQVSAAPGHMHGTCTARRTARARHTHACAVRGMHVLCRTSASLHSHHPGSPSLLASEASCASRTASAPSPSSIPSPSSTPHAAPSPPPPTLLPTLPPPPPTLPPPAPLLPPPRSAWSKRSTV